MKKIFLMTMLSLTFIACDRPSNPNTSAHDNDNTAKNARDSDMKTTTPGDQSESEADRTITQKIRQAIVSDDSLSTNGKNVKVITIKGVVTLRGPVASPEEKNTIANKVKNVPGVSRVDNQLEVVRNR